MKRMSNAKKGILIGVAAAAAIGTACAVILGIRKKAARVNA